MRQSEERYTKNLSRLDNRPAALREKIFSKLFAAASVARFTPTELREYEDSLKAYRDIKNSLDTAKEEGREEGLEEGLAKGREEGLAKGREEGLAKGRAEGIALVAKAMYAKGMDVDTIASMVGMAKGEVERLCRQ
ncbi:PD-(D/E)XK nuclease family transposase [uncultured Prevotella sp.]|uniref:PD-(D/E)XK nuclease family transposase n=1 Tax=uncultured Prevotella sp. TaxID=159272 RepID=UPI0025DE4B6B|nr:PD-(D/E)XK nuclease family transposase [uncultured Prevotella sp.]